MKLNKKKTYYCIKVLNNKLQSEISTVRYDKNFNEFTSRYIDKNCNCIFTSSLSKPDNDVLIVDRYIYTFEYSGTKIFLFEDKKLANMTHRIMSKVLHVVS